MGQKLQDLFSQEHAVRLSCLLLVGAFLVRILRVFQDTVIAHDGILYIKMAKIVALGEFGKISEYSFFNLYPVLIALMQSVFGDWELSGRMVSVLLGALTVIPLFLMVRRMMDHKVALVACFLYMIGPSFVEYSSDVLRESTFWFFSTTALWLAWEGIDAKKWYLFSLSSLFAGMAIFTRIEGISVFILILFWVSIFLKKREVGLRKVLLFLFIFIVSFPIFISPPLWVLKSRLGKWEFGQVGGYVRNFPNLLYGTEEVLEASPEVWDKMTIPFRGFVEMSKKNRYVLFLWEVIYKFFKSLSVTFSFLFLFGIVRRKLIPYSKNELALLTWFGILFLSSFFYMTKHYYFSTRHGLLMGLPALVWSGMGFYELKNTVRSWIENKERFSALSRATGLILVLLIFIPVLLNILLSSQDAKIVLKETGAYLKASGYGKSIFAVQPGLMRVAFYADSKYVLLPPGRSFEETMKFMKENQVSLLVVDEETIESYSKDLVTGLSRLDIERIPIPPSAGKGGYSIVVYRLQ